MGDNVRDIEAGFATPEPATLLLVGTGAAGVGLARWRKRRRAAALWRNWQRARVAQRLPVLTHAEFRALEATDRYWQGRLGVSEHGDLVDGRGAG